MECKRWLAAMALCVLTAWFFSDDFSKKSLIYPVFHPLEFLKKHKDDSFRLIFPIFKPNVKSEKIK